jgi:hypothetical protein
MGEEDYNFELRFRDSLEEHREKLDALSPEKRELVEKEWREKFAAHEKEESAYLNKFDGSYTFEGHTALLEKREADAKALVDQAHRAHIEHDEKLRAQIKEKARQGRDREDGRER